MNMAAFLQAAVKICLMTAMPWRSNFFFKKEINNVVTHSLRMK